MSNESKVTNQRHRICIIGCFEFGARILETLHATQIYDICVVTLTPKQAEQYEVSNFFDYSDIITKKGLTYFNPDTYSLESDEDKKYFIGRNFDVLIIGGWNRLIPEDIIKTIRYCGIGIHGSPNLLPVGRGRSPMNWSLIKGESRFIMHLFKLSSGIDDGEILALAPFQITNFDTIETLYLKSTLVINRALPTVIENVLKRTEVSFPQQGVPEYFPKRRPLDGKIEWNIMSMFEIYNFIRAQTKPYPGAYSYIDGKLVKIWDAVPFDETIIYPGAKYGEVVEIFGDRLLVNCRGGSILLKDFEGITAVEVGMSFENDGE